MKEKIIKYIKENILIELFIIVGLLNGIIIRLLTIGNMFSIKPIVGDLIILMLLGAFSYFLNTNKKAKYFFILLSLATVLSIINSIYFDTYSTYISFTIIKTWSQFIEVTKLILINIDSIKHFIYLLGPIIYLTVYKILKEKLPKDTFNKRKAFNIFLITLFIMFSYSIALSKAELYRFNKQWNREYIVSKFGIYAYQINDGLKSIGPKFEGTFGYDDAMIEFKDFFSEKEKQKNNYTNIYKDKNIITIQLKNVQSFVMDLEFNDVEVTPNLNYLAENGIYFSNFYAQNNLNSSTDTEFTINTGLLPTTNNSVFLSYWDREYITFTKLLGNNNYYSNLMYAENAESWNRRVMYKEFGYSSLYTKKYYEIDEVIGNNLSDLSFFNQSVDKIKNIKQENDKYYINLIMSSNESPYNYTDGYIEYNINIKMQKENEDGEIEQIEIPYIEDLKIGDYIQSVHYTDYAIGEFIKKLEEENLLDNTVLIIYGDKEAGLSPEDYNILYNYDLETEEMLNEYDEGYKEIDKYTYELNKNIPFIIYSSDKKIKKEITTVAGAYDVLPTLANMFGIYNEYALGNDIFNLNDNIVVFPNGDYITNKIYYNKEEEEYLVLTQDPLEDDYIENNTILSNKILNVSNYIIKYDLIRKSKENEEVMDEIMEKN